MTILIDNINLKQYRDSAINVTNNGLFGSTWLSQADTSVCWVHRAVGQLLNIKSIRDHSEDGSFGGSQGSSDLAYTPPLSHTRSE